jgi:predicted GNAT family N-acyltransferase
MPKFFASHEEKLLRKYLIKVNINYYLFFNREESLVASGGYEYEEKTNTIVLTWGMVDQSLHNQGYGSHMIEYRLKKIKKEFSRTNIILNTSQHTFKFYEKFGFELVKIKRDGYGPGLDRYDMIFK